jgi:protein transport protein SEC61 subunit gamma-like protein
MDVKLELSSYVRVLKLASTPSWDEFSKISKIAGAGIVFVGLLGFVIFAIMHFAGAGPA